MPPRISICVAACNEQGKLHHALESARACSWCDELLVFDSGSTDNTVNIAREFADRVEFHEWVDYTTSKRRMTDAARNDWVFILDADEQIPPELAVEIERLDDHVFDHHAVMTVPRKNYMLGRHVRSWDPDRIDRLFHRTRVRWRHRAVHDSRVPIEGDSYHLSSPLLHNLHDTDWHVFFDGPRYAARTEMFAREMFDQGKRVGFISLLLRPWLTFLKYYFLKKGFLQGAFGLLSAQKSAWSVHLKYARLWHLQQLHRKGEARPDITPNPSDPMPMHSERPTPIAAESSDDATPV